MGDDASLVFGNVPHRETNCRFIMIFYAHVPHFRRPQIGCSVYLAPKKYSWFVSQVRPIQCEIGNAFGDLERVFFATDDLVLAIPISNALYMLTVVVRTLLPGEFNVPTYVVGEHPHGLEPKNLDHGSLSAPLFRCDVSTVHVGMAAATLSREGGCDSGNVPFLRVG